MFNKPVMLLLLMCLSINFLSCSGSGGGGESSSGTTPVSSWSTIQFGQASGESNGKGIVVDSSGNVFLVGIYGVSPYTTSKNFAAKYNSISARQWYTEFDGPMVKNWGLSIAKNSSGSIFVAGASTDITSTSNYAYVRKFESSGTAGWTGFLSGGLGSSVTIDPSDNVILVGRATSTFESLTLTGMADLFLVKFNSSGTKQWTRLLGASSGTVIVNGVCNDSSGDIYVTGYTDRGLDGNTQTGLEDLFVAKYNSSGTKQWVRQLGIASNSTKAYGIACDSTGNIYVTGHVNSGLDGNTLIGSQDLFLVKYNSSGTKQWTKQLGAVGAASVGNAVAVDANGYLYVTGLTYGGFDGNSKIGDEDCILLKFDNTGTKVWSKQFGVSGKYTGGWNLNISSSNLIYVVGVATGSIDGKTLTGLSDTYVRKFDSDGQLQ